MKTLLPLLLLSLACLAGCVTKLPPPPEALGSFDVKLDFTSAPSPGDVTSTCGFNGSTDLCPGAAGTDERRIPYPGDRYAQVRLSIRAVSNRRVSAEDTTVFPYSGPVTIGVRAGEIFGALQQITLTDGVADNVIVRVRRTPGPTYLWVEDDQPREDGTAPSYATGLTDAPLFFEQPLISDIQTTDSEETSPLTGQRVELTRGQLYVSRITGSGFNVQDVSAPEAGGLFVFAFNGIQGLRTGTRLLSLSGGLTEFQGSTQLTEPVFTPVNGLCRTEGSGEGGIDLSEEDIGSAVVKCPRGTGCIADENGVDRCTPDSDPSLDRLGRKVCTDDSTCPAGTSCQTLKDQGTFCQVKPVPMVASAFPKAPSCGTTRTDQLSAVEKLEGSLVQLTSSSTQGVRLGGLPVCKRPEGDDPIHAVRSTCNLQQTIDGQVRPVEAPDCTVAGLGDPILRDALNRPCFRGNQACKDDGRPAAGLRSTCNPAATESCALAEPGDKVLRDEHGSICRNTFDDFLTSGLAEFGQAKALFEVNEGGDTVTRCATVNFDGLTGFSAIDAQERGMRYRSLTGTLRQVRFSSGSSFWIVDVRFPEDLEPLPAAAP